MNGHPDKGQFADFVGASCRLVADHVPGTLEDCLMGRDVVALYVREPDQLAATTLPDCAGCWGNTEGGKRDHGVRISDSDARPRRHPAIAKPLLVSEELV